MQRLLTSLIVICITSIQSFGQNSVRILPDSTGKFIKIEVARKHSSVYKIKLIDEKNHTLHVSSATIDSIPKVISIDWYSFKPGFYYAIIENKRETIKLLFIKKENDLPNTIDSLPYSELIIE